MDNAVTHKCNEFIINNGEFVRDFEGMYKNIVDPWNQQRDNDSDIAVFLAMQLLCFIVNSHRISINSIMDVGCADGYHARKLQHIFTEGGKQEYFGTDISSTVIKRAESLINDCQCDCRFFVDDITKYNDALINRFDIIFSSRTLYYVAPEIDAVIDNIRAYLSSNGIFCFIYNQSKGSYTSQWLTYKLLREKLLALGFIEHSFVEVDRYSQEVTAIGVYQKKMIV
jgi:SAM-dependent methyltransferase